MGFPLGLLPVSCGSLCGGTDSHPHASADVGCRDRHGDVSRVADRTDASGDGDATGNSFPYKYTIAHTYAVGNTFAVANTHA